LHRRPVEEIAILRGPELDRVGEHHVAEGIVADDTMLYQLVAIAQAADHSYQ
jgi:hypothetical protein